MNLAHNPLKQINVGQSGTGKTLLANEFILVSNYDFYFIFDHEGQFAERNKLASAFTVAQMIAQLKRQRFVVFNPSEMFVDMGAALNWFACWVYKFSERHRGTKLFFCDEIQDVVDPRRDCPFWVKRMLVSGRNKELDFLGTSLQYNMVHNAIRGQATITVAFLTDEPLALKDLVVRGFKAHEVASLKPGEYILRDKRKNIETRGRIIFPKKA